MVSLPIFQEQMDHQHREMKWAGGLADILIPPLRPKLQITDDRARDPDLADGRHTGTRTFLTSSIGGVPVTAELGAHDVHEQGGTLVYAAGLNRAIPVDPATNMVIRHARQ